jgi:hypothetical protein
VSTIYISTDVVIEEGGLSIDYNNDSEDNNVFIESHSYIDNIRAEKNTLVQINVVPEY